MVGQRIKIMAFGEVCDGWIHDTTMMEGELTHVIHFWHPRTGTVLVTTRDAKV